MGVSLPNPTNTMSIIGYINNIISLSLILMIIVGSIGILFYLYKLFHLLYYYRVPTLLSLSMHSLTNDGWVTRLHKNGQLDYYLYK